MKNFKYLKVKFIILFRYFIFLFKLIELIPNCFYYRTRLGIDYILEVEQTLDRSDRCAAKFHHFHRYQIIVFIYIT